MVHPAALTPVLVVLVAVGLALAVCGQAAAPTGSSLAAVPTVAAPPAPPAPAVQGEGPSASATQRPPVPKVEFIWSTAGSPTSPRLPIALARDGQGQLIVLDAATGAHPPSPSPFG